MGPKFFVVDRTTKTPQLSFLRCWYEQNGDKLQSSSDRITSKEPSQGEVGNNTRFVLDSDPGSEDGEETQAYEMEDAKVLMADSQIGSSHRERQANTPEPVPESQLSCVSPVYDTKLDKKEVVCDEDAVAHKLPARKESMRDHFAGLANMITLWPSLYVPRQIKDPACYTQVIRLMLDIYIRRLHRAQLRMATRPRAWGKPVKAGPHVEECLMKQKTDSDDETNEKQERCDRSLRSKRPAGKNGSLAQTLKVNHQKSDDSDEDFEMIHSQLSKEQIRPASFRKLENQNDITARKEDQPSRLRRINTRTTFKCTLDEEDAKELFTEEEKDDDLIIKDRGSESEDEWLPSKKQDKKLKSIPPSARGRGKGRGRGKEIKEKILKLKDNKQKINLSTSLWFGKKRTEPEETLTSKDIANSKVDTFQRKKPKQEHKPSAIEEDKFAHSGNFGKISRRKEPLKMENINNILDSDEEEMTIRDRRCRKVVDCQDKNIEENPRDQAGSQNERYFWSDSESSDNSLPCISRSYTDHRKHTDSNDKRTVNSLLSMHAPDNQKEKKKSTDAVMIIHGDDSSNDQKSSGSVKFEETPKADICNSIEARPTSGKGSPAEQASDSIVLLRTSSDIPSSSESLLDMQGNFYSTQLLHTKRKPAVINVTKRSSRLGVGKSECGGNDLSTTVEESYEKQNRGYLRTRKHFGIEAAHLESNSEDELIEPKQAKGSDRKPAVTQGGTKGRKRTSEIHIKKEKDISDTAVSKTIASTLDVINERPVGNSDSSNDLEAEIATGPRHRASDNLKRKLISTKAVDKWQDYTELNLDQDLSLKKRKVSAATADSSTEIISRRKKSDKPVERTKNVKKPVRYGKGFVEQSQDVGSSSEQSSESDGTESATKQKSDSHYLMEKKLDMLSLAGTSRQAPRGTCPICGDTFLLTALEAHASTCGEELAPEGDDEQEARCMYCNEQVETHNLGDRQANCSAQEDRPTKRQTRSLRNF